MQKIREEYGEKVAITWKPFPLFVQGPPPHIDRTYINRVLTRVCEEEGSISCKLVTELSPVPSSSLPALVAGKCAQLQGEDAFERYHMALLRVPIEENRDISSRDVLISVAKENGLDVDRFVSDFDNGDLEARIIAEYKEITKDRQFSGIPTVVFGNQVMLEGAVPVELYRRAVERLLSS